MELDEHLQKTLCVLLLIDRLNILVAKIMFVFQC